MNHILKSIESMIDMIFDFKSIFRYVYNWLQYIFFLSRTILKSSAELKLENLALISQIVAFHQDILADKLTKPFPTPAFRQLWVILSLSYSGWKSALVLVNPQTVIGWHKTAFKSYWKKKSRKPGRPKISPATIALIKRIHQENSLLSSEKIHEHLVDLAITDTPSPNTISKYIPETRKPPSEKQVQSWRTFLSNHSKKIWSMDFFTVPTLFFDVLYVLIIISHDRGSMFISKEFQNFLENTNIISQKISYRSPWQNSVCERTIGILRRELTDHIIPLNEKRLRYLLREYFINTTILLGHIKE